MQQSAEAHFAYCQRRLTKPKQFRDRAQDGHRWPGYLGAQWEPGQGVLFVGSIHGDFRGSGGHVEGRQPLVDRLIDANEHWRDNPSPTQIDDEQYLTTTRNAYTSLMDYWPRAKQFRTLLQSVFRDADRPYDHAAWTNLAHCRSRGGVVDELTLQERCSGSSGAYPIGDLIGVLWPRVIICSVLSVGASRSDNFDFAPKRGATEPPNAYDGPIIRAFHGLHGTWNGQRQADWLRDLADEMDEPKGRSAGGSISPATSTPRVRSEDGEDRD